MPEQTKFRACPCCGGAAKLRRDGKLGMTMIVCTRCGMSSSPRGNLERTITAWNKRCRQRDAAEHEVLRSAIEHYGVQHQLTVALEELSELQKEICKSIRGGACSLGMAEEVADTEIMLEQIRLIFPDEEKKIGIIRKEKLDRLKKRIEERDVSHG